MRKYLELKLEELKNKEHLSMYDLGQINLLDDIFDFMLKKASPVVLDEDNFCNKEHTCNF